MTDIFGLIADKYGVARRELTIGQIEDFLIGEIKFELGEEASKRGNIKEGVSQYNYIDNPINKQIEEIGVVGGREGKISETEKRFKKPTLEAIRTYCSERRNGIDPEQFFDYYESKGWIIGKNGQMKDWKAAVRLWERRKKLEPAKQQTFKGFKNFEERSTNYDDLFNALEGGN